jgi:serine/threonine protein kinase
VDIDAFPAGKVINERYLVLGRLGAGGFGTVLKVRDQEEARDVALRLTLKQA